MITQMDHQAFLLLPDFVDNGPEKKNSWACMRLQCAEIVPVKMYDSFPSSNLNGHPVGMARVRSNIFIGGVHQEHCVRCLWDKRELS